MLTGEQVERLEALLADLAEHSEHPGPWNMGMIAYYGGEDICVEAVNALPALLQLARAVSEAPRREVRECCGHLLVGNEWDEADAAIDAMRGQTVALVPVPVKEG